jgi:hypothetical protein
VRSLHHDSPGAAVCRLVDAELDRYDGKRRRKIRSGHILATQHTLTAAIFCFQEHASLRGSELGETMCANQLARQGVMDARGVTHNECSHASQAVLVSFASHHFSRAALRRPMHFRRIVVLSCRTRIHAWTSNKSVPNSSARRSRT